MNTLALMLLGACLALSVFMLARDGYRKFWHWHACENCKRVFDHDDSNLQCCEAHRCPSCGCGPYFRRFRTAGLARLDLVKRVIANA
jgi:rRNA maturation endonuclease Nob1